MELMEGQKVLGVDGKTYITEKGDLVEARYTKPRMSNEEMVIEGMAEYLSRNTGTNQAKVKDWILDNYEYKEVIDLGNIFEKGYVNKNDFSLYILNNERMPTYTEFKRGAVAPY